MTVYDTKLFPHAQVKRLVAEEGIERVSNEAVQELEKMIFEHGEIISKEAIFLANKNGRSTVRAEDIGLAISNIAERI